MISFWSLFYCPFVDNMDNSGVNGLVFLFRADFCIIAAMKARSVQRHLQQVFA
jgi:hypothetical protein